MAEPPRPDDQQPITNIVGEKVALGPIRRDLTHLFQMWSIGNAGLEGIDHAHGTAEFFIEIGDKESWGKGYGTEVTRLVLEYGFTCLGLHNINLWVFATHERGIRAYQRAGFRMAGRWRQAKRRAGRAYDLLLMDCLATEFQGGSLSYLMPQSSEVNE